MTSTSSVAVAHRPATCAPLARYCTIEQDIKVLPQDKSAHREEWQGRGRAMQPMTAASAMAQKRQLVLVARETLDTLSSAVAEKLPAPEDEERPGGGTPAERSRATERSLGHLAWASWRS